MITANSPHSEGAATVKATLLTSKDLRPTERLVLVAIAAHTNRDGDAWPSVATIADYTGVSVRTVQRALAELVHLGRLAVRHAATITTRVYRLLTPEQPGAGGDTTHGGVTPPASRGDTQAVSPEAQEDHTKSHRRLAVPTWYRPAARSRRRMPSPSAPHPRRLAMTPGPLPTADQCPHHRGSLATNCGPCRSERLAARRD
jgi:DNA-binding transcriptional MocR family regulator